MNKIKLVGFDLDGTMLRTGGYISEHTLKVLKKAKENGVYLVPVTGRAPCEMKNILKDLTVRYVVSVNGSLIYDVIDDKVIHRVIPNQEKLLEKLKIALSLDVYTEVYCGEIYTNKYCFDNMKELGMLPHLLETIRSTRTVVPDLYEEIKNRKQAEKLNIWFHDQQEKLKYTHLFVDEENFSHTTAFINALEVGVKNMDKGVGISMIAEILGIKQHEVMAIGDAANDIPMISWAGLGVAMENATKEVKDVADVVTLSNDQDGCAFAIEKYCTLN